VVTIISREAKYHFKVVNFPTKIDKPQPNCMFCVQDFELLKQFNAALQEKSNYVQQLFDGHQKVQSLEAKLASLQTDLTNVSREL
jgi:hypothetical protein